jgi:aminoglycoside phosphotransferase (APT) family kinase protein
VGGANDVQGDGVDTAAGAPAHAVDGAALRDALAGWVADELGADVAIGSLRRTSAGFSRENWVFDAALGDGRHLALIARRDPVGSVLHTDRRVETAVLRHLADTAVPVPGLRWVDLEGRRLGRPTIVMDLVEGACDGFVLNGPAPLEQRVALAHEMYDRLADIHLVDVGDLDLDDPGPAAALAAVDHWEAELARVQLEPEPELAFVLGWLRANAPSNAVTTLVHGDFKPGNVLVADGRVTAVLDWETAHLGDPHEDLGWVTNPLRQGEHRIPGAWEPDDLLERWALRTGMEVDRDAVRWWQVLANLKLAVIVLSGTHAFVDGRLDRIYQSPVRIHQLLLRQIAEIGA